MAVTVVRDAIGGRKFNIVGEAETRMLLYSESGKLALAVDVAPQEIDYGGWAMDWAEAERSGNKPLLLHKGLELTTMAFDFMLLDKIDMQAPQTTKLARLREVARTYERVLVAFSVAEQGLWRITDLSVKSQTRAADDDSVTRAQISVTLTEASDPAPAVGPISRPPAPPPAPPPVRRTYRVVRGDTLWGISYRFYRRGSLWPRIYDANRRIIRDPHWIFPSQVLVIP